MSEETEGERIERMKRDQDEKFCRENGYGKTRKKFPSNLTPKKKKRKK
jgi:hypothetical protein